MTTSSRTLGEWFDSFEREAFRLETLDNYNIPRSEGSFASFLAGKEQPESFKNSEWVTTVRDATRAGKRMYRVHILSRPLTDYLRYELAWGYHRNMAVGEEFFILDTTERENPIPEAPDFWLFDDSVTARMNYDATGAYLGADFPGKESLPEFQQYRDRALAEAVPFPEWWAKHGTE
ncbi:DUF6879 family protein [Streptomyces sp. URMC 129]|uniref:DUF6879 family protein n=1 Tax=Streptomyces sp. URMC 129 TaxID=3423407 RepID=UPI003F19F515